MARVPRRMLMYRSGKQSRGVPVQVWRVKGIRGLFRSAEPRTSRARRIGAVGLVVFLGVFQLAGSLGLRINTSPSLPVGLYITTDEAAGKLVEFCPAEPYA